MYHLTCLHWRVLLNSGLFCTILIKAQQSFQNKNLKELDFFSFDKGNLSKGDSQLFTCQVNLLEFTLNIDVIFSDDEWNLIRKLVMLSNFCQINIPKLVL